MARYEKLAYRWAPINYQYVDFSNPKRDMLCAINFDGDWDTKNNQRNLYSKKKSFQLKPVVYYSVAETSTHYYILYCFYHADDTTHANDLEGCLSIIKKNKKKDELLGMITVAHLDFWSFIVDEKLKPGSETKDGKLHVEKHDGEDHPMIKQEAGKHGLYAWKSKPKWIGVFMPKDKMTNEGIRYVPGKKATILHPEKISSFANTEAKYELIDMLGSEGFWKRRNDLNLFKKWGVFNSNTHGSANAPWTWKDHNDGFPAGLLFYDPAAIASRYFAGFEKFDNQYVKTMFG